MGCSNGGKPGTMSPELDRPFDQSNAAMERQCATLMACYPELNAEDDGVCWGPTGTGRHGWGLSSASSRAMQRQCLERVSARAPDATDDYLTCFAELQDAVAACIDDSDCSPNISECVALSKDGAADCLASAGASFNTALAEECESSAD